MSDSETQMSLLSHWEKIIKNDREQLAATQADNKRLRDEIGQVKSNLMHHRRFGCDTFQAWKNAAAMAEGDIEEALSHPLNLDALHEVRAGVLDGWSAERAYHEGRGMYECAMLEKGEPWCKFWELTSINQAYWVAKAAMLYATPVPPSQEDSDKGFSQVQTSISRE